MSWGVYVLFLEATALGDFSFILRTQMYGSNWLLDLSSAYFRHLKFNIFKETKTLNIFIEVKYVFFPYFIIGIIIAHFRFLVRKWRSALSSSSCLHSPYY